MYFGSGAFVRSRGRGKSLIGRAVLLMPGAGAATSPFSSSDGMEALGRTREVNMAAG